MFHFTNSIILIKESSLLLFYNNEARQNGGVGYFKCNSQSRLEGTVTVRFDNNVAKQNAGVFYSVRSNITFKEKSTITVTGNKAALYMAEHYILLKALPRVCMENTVRGGVSRDNYDTRRSRVLYLSRDTSPILYFSYKRAKAVL